MRHDWIIDVLTDLKTFAQANALDALAEQLDEAQLVAEVEMASDAGGNGIGLRGGQFRSGRVSGTA
ncbi:MAG: hypothetical protein CML50_18975 [Rhodobacteraceae bacterium]|jgi:hypothetical protein|uniref:Uncharacterized protein n=1 Tax=Salipiger profundus TaxID=1229727 RepID=A0A1U7D184_9RHOB|nr:MULTISPECIES: hypothetical protein [Salipiger]APX21901.1 hypothetical protein Ga0080559_TMP1105 [Salipiger profundus]MAB08083.1 hypothetical protein [Paracoccaceae bacterium]GGA06112.1 hypothetical protein GCM10011326_17250 [Salipiger profundus]SFC36459.1 hypothetical protein SAMN05444415_10394 [Salipiger profundus]